MGFWLETSMLEISGGAICSSAQPLRRVLILSGAAFGEEEADPAADWPGQLPGYVVACDQATCLRGIC
jgi:hypothetical protein